jgi:hypothetical protein
MREDFQDEEALMKRVKKFVEDDYIVMPIFEDKNWIGYISTKTGVPNFEATYLICKHLTGDPKKLY